MLGTGKRDLASEYEKQYPNTGCSDAQKEERMERMIVKDRRRSSSRPSIIVPELPWKKD